MISCHGNLLTKWNTKNNNIMNVISAVFITWIRYVKRKTSMWMKF